MFSISEETKATAVEKMKEILGPDVPEDKLLEAFEAAVRVVARSFGM